MRIKSYDIFGNIALVKFQEKFRESEKKKFALNLIKENKSIKTVLEKTSKIRGRLRKFSTKFLAGENTKEVVYHENDCVFRFNIDNTYFSPRLSNERKEIALKIKKDDNVLVLFAGVAPFSIVIAKKSRAKKVDSVEINRQASKYAELNVELNRLKGRVNIIQADVKKLGKKLCKGRLSKGNHGCPRYDVIVMPRPQLKETFLSSVFPFAKKGTKIFYYDFCKIDEINLIIEKIKKESEKSKKKIKILNIKEAGEIAPYKIRVRVDFEII